MDLRSAWRQCEGRAGLVLHTIFLHMLTLQNKFVQEYRRALWPVEAQV
jgi:hypothetical protein